MASLYELTKEIRQIAWNLDQAMELDDIDGIFDFAEELALLEMPFEQKIENYVKWVKNLEGEQEQLANEVARLQKRKASVSKQIEYAKGILRDALKAAGERNIKLPIATVFLRKNGKRIDVDETQVNAWPVSLWERGVLERIETIRIHKSELRNVPGYESLPGVTIIEGEEGVQIR